MAQELASEKCWGRGKIAKILDRRVPEQLVDSSPGKQIPMESGDYGVLTDAHTVKDFR
jgi:hypothetical protein